MLIEKNFDERDAECFRTSDVPYLYSRYQLEVSGVGRIRTGKKHSNFHLTEMRKPGQIEQTKKVKTYSHRSRKKASAKMEIAYNRS